MWWFRCSSCGNTNSTTRAAKSFHEAYVIQAAEVISKGVEASDAMIEYYNKGFLKKTFSSHSTLNALIDQVVSSGKALYTIAHQIEELFE